MAANKAVLVGGECDGQVVRLHPDFEPPRILTVLLDEPTRTPQADPDEMFVAPVNAFPAAAAGRPVTYHRFNMTGAPRASRVSLYVPAGYPTQP